LSPIVEDPRILLYSRIRKSPFFAASRRHGVAMYSVYNHMDHPRHYGDPVAEYWQLLDGVTLWDVGVERQVEITGPDAFAFANMCELRGGSGVAGLEHVPRCATDEDLAAQRLTAAELEILQVLLGPPPRQLARRLGLVGIAEDAQRDDLAVAAVHELVRHESRPAADVLGEALVDPAREFFHRPALQAIPPDACEHSLLPSSGQGTADR
jgi:hypothetical protein